MAGFFLAFGITVIFLAGCAKASIRDYVLGAGLASFVLGLVLL